MSRQLHIDLLFNADTSSAKAQIQSLQQSMNQLTTSMASQGAQFGLTPQLQQAQQAAVQLRTALQQSVNVNTGQFDLTKFSSSLKSMGTNLSMLKTQLISVGPTGQQAFMSLAQSIMAAEIPTKRISASLMSLGTTLKNTLKWQLSSSMLHGFMGAIQTSYRYAQDLNESLNDIRIVTGESIENMDKFAEKANKAAAALSTSTLEYTKASLILYQQGLSGKEVEDRANVMIKMANVTGQTAETVSNQMTAIWNNFYDGSKSLEHYADVLTALGAATASSTDEIAGGLEKFAAIADTIGLSYEYAASALATITANTRESETVVGTALKTIFARIQGLKLGETLEDGVELNKYSEALDKIGVDVLDVNDNLIDANTILDKTAEKWSTLTQAQKTATAQTVAGIRQYNQFIALMDNWDDGTSDSMVANLQTANNSTGELQRQADIYAESWEGANKRVKAAAEAVYTDLLSDDFFIKITNGLADVLKLIDNFLDAMGGAKGLLQGLGSILLTTFSGAAAKGLENMVYNFKTFVGLTQKEAMQTQVYTAALATGMKNEQSSTPLNTQQSNITIGMEGQVTLQHELLKIKSNLSEQDNLIAQGILQQNQAYAEQVRLLGEAVDLSEQKKLNSAQNLDNQVIDAWASDYLPNMKNPETLAEDMEKLYVTNDKVVNKDLEQSRTDLFNNINTSDAEAMKAALLEYAKKLREGADEIETAANGESTELSQSLKKQAQEIEKGVKQPKIKTETLQNRIQDIQNDKNNTQILNKHQVTSTVTEYGKNKVNMNLDNRQDKGSKEYQKAKKQQDALNHSVENHTKIIKTNHDAVKTNSEGIKTYGQYVEEAKQRLQGMGNATMSWSQMVIKASQSAMSLGFAISSIKSLFSTWADDTIGTGEKILQTFMSLGMAIPMLINGFSGVATVARNYIGVMNSIQTSKDAVNKLIMTSTILESQETQAILANSGAMSAQQLAEKTGMSISQASLVLDQNKAKQLMLNAVANKALLTEEEKLTVAKLLGISTEQTDIIMKKLSEGATWKQATSEVGLGAAKKFSIAATWEQIKANMVLIGQFAVMLAPIIAITAAIAALIFIAKAHINAYNQEANAAKEAAEQAKLANEAYQEAKTAYEDFVGTISDYKEAINGLQQLSKGTVEYKEKLLEANDAALQLINSGDMVYGKYRDYYYDEDGLIQITKGGMERAHERKLDSQKKAQSRAISANINSKQARTQADLVQFNREKLTKGDTINAIGEGVAYATTGAILGSVVPGIGTAVGAAVGAAIGAGVGIWTASVTPGRSTSEEEEAMKKIAENYEKIGAAALTSDQIEAIIGKDNPLTQELIQLSKDQSSGFAEQIAALAENTAAIRAQTEATIAGANTDNVKYNSLSDQEQRIVDKVVAKRVTDEEFNAMDPTSEAYLKYEAMANAKMRNKNIEDYETESANWWSGQNEEKTYDLLLDTLFTGAERDNYYIKDKNGYDFTIMQRNADGSESVWNGQEADSFTQEWAERTIVEGQAKRAEEEDIKFAQKVHQDSQFALEGISLNDDNSAIFNDMAEGMINGEAIDFSLLSKEERDKLKENILTESGEIKEAFKEYGAAIVEGLENWNEAAHKKREKQVADQKIEAAASKYELDPQVLKTQAKLLQQNVKELKDSAIAAADMAIANQRLNKGVSSLTDNWSDWKKTLKGTDKTTQDYAEAIVGVSGAIREMLNLTDETLIPEDFAGSDETLNLLDQISNGSEEAANQLGNNFVKAQIQASEASEQFNNTYNQQFKDLIESGDAVDASGAFDQIKTAAFNAVTEMQEAFAGLNPGDVISDPNKVNSWATALNEYALATNMSVEEMNKMLANMQVKADVKTTEVDVQGFKPKVTTKREISGIDWQDDGQGGQFMAAYTMVDDVTTEQVPTPEKMQVAQINTDEPVKVEKTAGAGPITPSATTGKKKSGGSGGGKSSGPAKKQPSKQKYQVKDKTEHSSKELDAALKKLEKTFGTNTFDEAFKKYKTSYDKHVKNLTGKLTQTQTGFQNLLKEKGLSVEFDTDGSIKNYEELEETITNKYMELYEYYSNPSNFANAEEQEKFKTEFLDVYDEWMNGVWEYVDEYESVKDEINAITKEINAEPIDIDYHFSLEISAQRYSLYAQEAADAVESARKSAERMAESIEFAAESLYGIAGLEMSMDVFNTERAGAKRVLGATTSSQRTLIDLSKGDMKDAADKSYKGSEFPGRISVGDYLKKKGLVDPNTDYSSLSQRAVIDLHEKLGNHNIRNNEVYNYIVGIYDHDPTTTNHTDYIGAKYGISAERAQEIANGGYAEAGISEEQWQIITSGVGGAAVDAILEDLGARGDAFESNTSAFISALENGAAQIADCNRTIADAQEEYADTMSDIERREIQRAAEILRETYNFTAETLDRFSTIANFKANGYDEDDFYSIAERANTLYGMPEFTKDANGKTLLVEAGPEYEVAFQKIQVAKHTVELAREQFLNKEIQQSRFYEILTEQADVIFENEEALREYEKAMMNLYLDTIPRAAEELAKYDNKLNSHTTLLEHYKNTLSLIGRGKDYKSIGAILSGQFSLVSEDIRKARQELAFWKGEEQEKLNQITNFTGDTNSEQYKILEKELAAIQEQVINTEQKIQSGLSSMGQIAMEEYTNQIQSAKKTLEDALAGDIGFDGIFKDLERISARQEGYLTKTNQAYETTTLMRKTWQAMDKTDNAAAKKKYAAFNTYLEGLAQQGELSEYELNIAKQKFELMQAEIALEEAQNAKNQVRLQRDSEGNFGYVYTANKEATDKAEQTVYDAQNKLYNSSLDTYNKLRSQIYTLEKETMEELEALSQKATEEGWDENKLNKESEKIIEHAKKQYTRLKGQYTQVQRDIEDFMDFGDKKTIYGVSTETLGEAYTDLNAFSLEWDATVGGVAENEKIYFQDMSLTAEGFTTQIQGFMGSITESYKGWQTKISPLIDDVGNSHEVTASKVKAATDEHTEYIDKVVGPNGVLKAINDETWEVKQLAKGWLEARDNLKAYRDEEGKYAEGLIKEAYDVSGVPLSDLANPAVDASGYDLQSDAIGKLIDYMHSSGKDWVDLTDSNITSYLKNHEEKKKQGITYNNEEYGADYYLQKRKEYAMGSTEYAVYDYLFKQQKEWWKKTDIGNEISDLANLMLNDDKNAAWWLDPRFEELMEGLIQKRASGDQYKLDYGAMAAEMEDSLLKYIYLAMDEYIKESEQKAKANMVEFENAQAKSIYYSTFGKESYDKDRYKIDYTTGYLIDTQNNNQLVSDFKWEDRKKVPVYKKFDTGGYTGDWGPEGRLAMLHEKELVLNKQDTANFLTATEILRDINQMLNRNAIAAQLGMIDLKAMTVNSQADQILQQEVTIHADFPNVTDHNEIELAMSNLINAASQYANREF